MTIPRYRGGILAKERGGENYARVWRKQRWRRYNKNWTYNAQKQLPVRHLLDASSTIVASALNKANYIRECICLHCRHKWHSNFPPLLLWLSSCVATYLRAPQFSPQFEHEYLATSRGIQPSSEQEAHTMTFLLERSGFKARLNSWIFRYVF